MRYVKRNEGQVRQAEACLQARLLAHGSVQGLLSHKIFNPQPNPQFDMSYMTCAAFGSPRVSSKLL
jgi:hypothetical protein